MTTTDVVPLRRTALREIMDQRRLSLDWLASEVGVPTECLRRWLFGYDPETNRQRLEWVITQDAVDAFLHGYERP
jgi:hypothetical protein